MSWPSLFLAIETVRRELMEAWKAAPQLSVLTTRRWAESAVFLSRDTEPWAPTQIKVDQ